MSRLPDLGFEDGEWERDPANPDLDPKCKVAVTTLAFKNSEIINLLRDRGYAIKCEDWEEQYKIE